MRIFELLGFAKNIEACDESIQVINVFEEPRNRLGMSALFALGSTGMLLGTMTIMDWSASTVTGLGEADGVDVGEVDAVDDGVGESVGEAKGVAAVAVGDGEAIGGWPEFVSAMDFQARLSAKASDRVLPIAINLRLRTK